MTIEKIIKKFDEDLLDHADSFTEEEQDIFDDDEDLDDPDDDDAFFRRWYGE